MYMSLGICGQPRPRSDCTDVLSDQGLCCPLSANRIIGYTRMYKGQDETMCMFVCVCVEVLCPSQPNGVMLSAVSLPNHTFTGQAVL